MRRRSTRRSASALSRTPSRRSDIIRDMIRSTRLRRSGRARMASVRIDGGRRDSAASGRMGRGALVRPITRRLIRSGVRSRPMVRRIRRGPARDFFTHLGHDLRHAGRGVNTNFFNLFDNGGVSRSLFRRLRRRLLVTSINVSAAIGVVGDLARGTDGHSLGSNRTLCNLLGRRVTRVSRYWPFFKTATLVGSTLSVSGLAYHCRSRSVLSRLSLSIRSNRVIYLLKTDNYKGAALLGTVTNLLPLSRNRVGLGNGIVASDGA